MKRVTIVVPHMFAGKWLQMVIQRLKTYQNENSFDILVVNNSLGHPSIKAITETSLGGGIKVIDPFPGPVLNLSHAGALDHALDFVETPWFFAMETDAHPVRDGWLDWYISQARDEEVAMVGWFWDSSPGRMYIAPCATLYNTRILKLLKKEVNLNPSFSKCWGKDLKKRGQVEGGNTFFIDGGYWGPFIEQRSFLIPGQFVPYEHQNSHDTGSWLYHRARCQWEVVHLPGVWKNSPIDPGISDWIKIPDKDNPYIIHYGAGTVMRCDLERNDLIISAWMRRGTNWLFEREDTLWQEVVPEKFRVQALELGAVRLLEEDVTRMKELFHPLKVGNRVVIRGGNSSLHKITMTQWENGMRKGIIKEILPDLMLKVEIDNQKGTEIIHPRRLSILNE